MTPLHPIQDLLGCFDQLYQQHNDGLRYPINGGKEAKIVQGLLEVYTVQQLKDFMAAFFEIEDDFIEQSGHSIGVFRGCLPKVIKHARQSQKPVREPWNCPHETECSHEAACRNATALDRPRKVVPIRGKGLNG